jgi:colanic acid/amylovoran biosynthesis glycosyltransferase
MRVALFTNQFPGRLNTFFIRDVGALIEHGFDVEVFPIYSENPAYWQHVPSDALARVKTCNFESGVKWALQGAIRYLKKPAEAVEVLRILVSAFRFGAFPVAKTAYASLKSAAFSEMHARKFDWIVSYWGNYAATAAYLFHRSVSPGAGFAFILNAGIDLYRDQVFLLEKIKYADIVFAGSEFNRRFIKNLYPEAFADIARKIHVHHNGLDLSEYRFSLDRREPATVLAAGSHHRRKGFDYVIRAVAALKTRIPSVRLRLVGFGPETRKLRRLATSLGIGDCVVFEGTVPIGVLADMMRSSTVLMHASPQLGDGAPTVIKEAMAIGLPVVATSIAAIPELLDYGACGILVPPRDVGALARGAYRLISDDRVRLELAARARLLAERKFNQQTNGAKLAECLRGHCRAYANS